MNNLAHRVRKLAANSRVASPDECPSNATTVIVMAGDAIPDGAATCPHCGGIHALVVSQELVQSTHLRSLT
jgi:hypothetical protein